MMINSQLPDKLNFQYKDWKDYNNKYYIDTTTCVEQDESIDILEVKVDEENITIISYSLNSMGDHSIIESIQEYGMFLECFSDICEDSPQKYFSNWKEITKEEFDNIKKFMETELQKTIERRNCIKNNIIKYKGL